MNQQNGRKVTRTRYQWSVSKQFESLFLIFPGTLCCSHDGLNSSHLNQLPTNAHPMSFVTTPNQAVVASAAEDHWCLGQKGSPALLPPRWGTKCFQKGGTKELALPPEIGWTRWRTWAMRQANHAHQPTASVATVALPGLCTSCNGMSKENAMRRSPRSCANGRGNGTSATFKQLLKPNLSTPAVWQLRYPKWGPRVGAPHCHSFMANISRLVFGDRLVALVEYQVNMHQTITIQKGSHHDSAFCLCQFDINKNSPWWP